jgi:hypothetical protein
MVSRLSVTQLFGSRDCHTAMRRIEHADCDYERKYDRDSRWSVRPSRGMRRSLARESSLDFIVNFLYGTAYRVRVGAVRLCVGQPSQNGSASSPGGRLTTTGQLAYVFCSDLHRGKRLHSPFFSATGCPLAAGAERSRREARRGTPRGSRGASPHRSDGKEEEWHDSIVSF